MKLRILNIITGLFVAACVMISCLDSDVTEFEFCSNASITKFSITDSIITRTEKDTTYVLGSDYPFVINQAQGLIYNPDSLPVGTDVSKVIVNISADTPGIFIVAETDSLWEDTDTLNFTQPIQFKVMSEKGTFGRIYTAQINVHKQDPDSLTWTNIPSNFNKTILQQKAVYANNHIYVFAEQGNQVAMTKANTEDGKTWTELETIDIPVKADYTSVIAYGNQFYILANKELYVSSNGVNWEKAGTQQLFSKLLVCTSKRIGAIDNENHYITSEDGVNWELQESMPADFPTDAISFASYPLATNPDINRVVLIGEKTSVANSDTTTTVWSQLDTEDSWIGLTSENNISTCPKLKNSQIIHYNNRLYLLGGEGKYNGTISPFQRFYVSVDNGITWSAINQKAMFPAEFEDLYQEADGNYSCIVDDQQFIWIMWSQTGEVWRGRINKLGFDN